MTNCSGVSWFIRRALSISAVTFFFHVTIPYTNAMSHVSSKEEMFFATFLPTTSLAPKFQFASWSATGEVCPMIKN
jgi:hypothetical protein